MGKAFEQRRCPALGREISAADCGDSRISRYACPADCEHNPFAPANYAQLLEIEDRLDKKTLNWLFADASDRAALAQALATRRFGAIEVEVWHEGAGHSPLRAMITAAYRPALVQGNRAILVPH